MYVYSIVPINICARVLFEIKKAAGASIEMVSMHVYAPEK